MLKTKRKLSQNWLINPSLSQKIVNLLEISPNDHIIEIGSGTGALTKILANLPIKLDIIEIDPECIAETKNHVSNPVANITYHNLDFRNFDYRFRAKLISNLPYHLTGEFWRLIFNNESPFSTVVVMVQKEVADNLVAKVPNNTFLSCLREIYYSVETNILVKKGNFRPIPKVDSRVLRLSKKDPQISYDQISKLIQWIKAGYDQKRKTLINNLSSLENKNLLQERLVKLGYSSNVRAQELSLEDWLKIVFTK